MDANMLVQALKSYQDAEAEEGAQHGCYLKLAISYMSTMDPFCLV
tara:strand:+ start:485 stop:619 length:135 start_codon:yes stop_codon:yes gene_type:complete